MPSIVRTLVVQPLGEPLGRLHAEAVHEQLLGKLPIGLELGHQLGDLRADRHRLHRDHVELGGPAVDAGRKKSARQMRSPLGWRGQTKRVQLRLAVLGVEHDDVVAERVAGKKPSSARGCR